MVPHECTISYDGDCRSVLNYRGAEPRRRSSLDHDRQRGHPALAGESGRMSDHENANKESQDSAASVGSGALLRGNGRSRRSCLKAPRVEKRQPHRSDGVNSRRAADSNANSCRFLLPLPVYGDRGRPESLRVRMAADPLSNRALTAKRRKNQAPPGRSGRIPISRIGRPVRNLHREMPRISSESFDSATTGVS